MTKLLQTTIAGSLPKPSWLAAPNELWAPWRLEGDALAEGKRDAVRLVLRDQEQAGIDIVSDGEQTRRHFVTTFIEALDGVDFEHKRTVRIRNRYDADVPVVVGPVARRHPVFVDDARFLRERDRPQGQVHAARADDDGRHAVRRPLQEPRKARLGVRRDPERGGARDRGGRRRRHPVRRAGVQRLLRRGPRLGRQTLERAAQGLRCTTAVHICYGYGIKANIDWKKTLGSEWRQYEQTFPLLARSAIGQVSLECANSHVPIELIGLLDGQGRAGRGDRRRHRPRRDAGRRRRDDPGGARASSRPSVSTPAPIAGWCPLARDVARGKLRALGAGAALVRAELGDAG